MTILGNLFRFFSFNMRFKSVKDMKTFYWVGDLLFIDPTAVYL